ncbi:DNA-directed RNA polymerase I subunit RPA2-like isoform X1 [Haliotis rufescens]|uniref:DNA-directed RNA polymerase I subunit RPA2-like isoform X1 n=1 Tax=Haliotis rufescens TaxID=6454 RepID=UPI00201EBAF9|nr:DNA-directed RNA polymerase I subunit RPA2-like isoform X1 [Haliotis rufescens]
MASDTEPFVEELNFKHLTVPDFGNPKAQQHKPLQDLLKPHIESFNYLIHEGLQTAVDDIAPLQFQLPNNDQVTLRLSSPSLGLPCVSESNKHASTLQVFPTECRQRRTSYKGSLDIQVSCHVGKHLIEEREQSLGHLPIMVKSDLCNLAKLTPAQLIQRKEDEEEIGGYFVINGNEKVIRMLILNRRNVPLCFKRERWRMRGKQYTEYGATCRCAKEDHEGQNMYLHYLTTGAMMTCFIYDREMFFIPLMIILKGLIDCSDKFIFDELTKGKEEDSFYKGCIVNMLQETLSDQLYTRSDILKYIGQHFRTKLANRYCPPWYTDRQAGELFNKHIVCLHLKSNRAKFDFLVHMTRKLYAFAKGECAADSPDNPMNQELLLSGHLMLMVIKEKMNDFLIRVKMMIMKAAEAADVFELTPAAFQRALTLCGGDKCEVTRSVEYLLSTGNLTSRSGLGLMQYSGFAIVADRLNFCRFLSHFRCVHRGAFFTTMRSTGVRKLRPEAWGFMCPVHTPDGAPCGLMNHLAHSCQVVTVQHNTTHLLTVMENAGLCRLDDSPPGKVKESYPVFLDGIPVGYITDNLAQNFCDRLRVMKVKSIDKVPAILEICLVPKTEFASQYPAVYLFLGPARMMRPVLNLSLGMVEMIGTFEQVYLDICITEEEFHPGVTTHQELAPTSILSSLANMTPFSDFNQSPRNMYQCQMAKQTLGTACHNITHRADNKLYRLLTPQSPLVRPKYYSDLAVDNYPPGTNAVIAVISYTGYDMEDAMIINKSSAERGLAHGCIYMNKFISLQTETATNTKYSCILSYVPSKAKQKWNLDSDGLPPVGAYLEEGDALYSYVNIQTGAMTVEKYKSQEAAYVDSVKIVQNPSDDHGAGLLQRAVLMLRVQRNPIIGDKFATRHGQKGICSMFWPAEDMPFTESGMTPDIIFNPHGFPSRMTIGMMIEIMAGKSSALHGLCHDATPFTFSEKQPAIDHFGNMLTAAGYNYYGTESMYSGVDGREMEVSIFCGIVYYQRLRHMVSDKFQVRSTGPVDPLTHQPVKGRKKAGGIRFGEMERDALIAHGAAFLIHDRLFNCSDGTRARICTSCGSLLSPCLDKPPVSTAAASVESRRVWSCKVCQRSDTIQTVAVPYVFRYLVAELAAMNIKLKLGVS